MNTLLVADEHAVVRRGIIASIKNGNTGLKIVEASDHYIIKQLLEENAVSHIILSDGLFLKSINLVRQHYPGVFALIFSAMPFTLIGETLLKAGTSGYLSKQTTANETIYGINHFLKYGCYLPSRIQRTEEKDELYNPFNCLSDRELEVITYLLEGLTVKEIAGRLSLSISAISTYKTRVQDKLHVNSVAGIAKMATLFSFSV